jgi:hypothetical protein
MVDESGYNQCVVRTFRENAVHTAMVIDDRFPTYADLTMGSVDASRFDLDKAGRVYKTFKDQHIPCDVENDVSRLGSDFEHVRKSDLIVLDYHLRGADSDSRDAVNILEKLQKSQHFNLVVLYTRDGDLGTIWLRVACSLRGGWREPSDILPGDTYEAWEDLANSGEFEISKEALAAYVLRTDYREERTRLAQVWLNNTNNPSAANHAVEAAFNRAGIKACLDGSIAEEKAAVKVGGRFKSNAPYWLQCGNVFTAFMQKRQESAVDNTSNDPEGILLCLDRALVDWRPNVLQVMISEIQNTLEQTGLAYAEDLLRSPAFQAAWIYNVIKEAQAEDGRDERLNDALEELYHRLVQSIERSLRQSRLPGFGVDVFKKVVDLEACASMPERDLVKQAVELTHSGQPLAEHIVVHALNSYLSSEVFEGTHITAGTIFKASNTPGWWVCVSPVCDMVPRPSRDGRSWQKELEPVRPMIALRLYEEGNIEKAMLDAQRGRILFVLDGTTPLCLRAFHDDTRQPWTEALFLCSQEWRDLADHGKRFCFRAQRVSQKDNIAEVTLFEFEAIAQLRDPYTSRLLQQTGAYTSRIGVDYVALEGLESATPVAEPTKVEPPQNAHATPE